MIRVAGAIFALLLAPLDATGASEPPWVRAAAAAAAPNARAVVLVDDVEVSFSPDGRIRTTRRYAVRINDRGARDAAVARELYLTDSGSVREMRGWLVRRSGKTRDLGKRDVVDVALVNNDVYNEVRAKVLAAAEDVAEGDIFAVEIESESRLPFPQFEWMLQERWPVVLSRRSLTLPAGWRADATVFNGPRIERRDEGNRSIWEVRDLAEVPVELAMPPLTELVPRLAVSIVGPAASAALPRFDSWSRVSSWLDALSAPAADAAGPVAAKAAELTSGLTGEFERITAIARFVQRIQYVSIQTGIGRGGGYQPRPASLVLSRSYGDCKDKANLMRAMLESVGISSHLAAIFSGDRNYVRPEWPSPQQFNHVILAVVISDRVPDSLAVLTDPRFGRLLLFDPTDEYTPVGELALPQQGSQALLVRADGGDLIRTPLTTPVRHQVHVEITGRLDEKGTLTADVHERLSGSDAVRERSLAAEGTASSSAIARRLAAAVPRAIVTSAQPGAATETGFEMRYGFSVPNLAQSQGPLVLVRAPLTIGERFELPSAANRRTAIQIEPRTIVERLSLQLPDTLRVDEAPAPVTLDTPFGTYALRYQTGQDALIVHRRLELPLQSIGPDQYAEARAFFDRIRAADRSPIVLSVR